MIKLLCLSFLLSLSIFSFAQTGSCIDSCLTVKSPLAKNGDTLSLNIDTNSLNIKGVNLLSKSPVLKAHGEIRSLATSDLDTGFIYMLNIGGQVGTFYYDPNDNSTPDDSAMVFVTTGGKRIKRVTNGILYPRWFGAAADGITDDAVAVQKMFDYMAVTQTTNVWKADFEGLKYLVNETIELPHMLEGMGIAYVDIDGNGAYLSTTEPIAIFRRIPTTSEAGAVISNWRAIIHNFNFAGTQESGQKALYLGACYSWRIHDCQFSFLDTAVDGRFWLHCYVSNNQFGQNYSGAFYGSEGVWEGATVTNSSFNFNVLDGNRIYNFDGVGHNALFGISIHGGDQTVVKNTICEGGMPYNEFQYDYAGNPGVQVNTIDQWWSESPASGNLTEGILFKIRGSAVFNIYNTQSVYKVRLLNIDSSDGGTNYNIQNFSYYYLSDTMFSAIDCHAYGIFMSGGSDGLYNLMNNAAHWKGNALPPLTFTYDGSFNNNMRKSNGTFNIYSPVRVYGATLINDGIFTNTGTTYLGGYTYHLGDVYVLNGHSIEYDRFGNSLLSFMFGDSSYLTNFNSNYVHLYTKIDKFGRWNFNGADNSYNSLVSYSFNGTDAMKIPLGTTAERPTGATGYLRINTDSANAPEFYDATNWNLLASRNWVRDNFSPSMSAVTNNIAALRDSLNMFRDSIAALRAEMRSSTDNSTLRATYIAGDDYNNANEEKILNANTFLERIIIRSSVSIMTLKIGTTPGGSEIWGGTITADDTDHTHDKVISIGRWLPKKIIFYFTGLAGTGGNMKVWYQ